MITERRSSVFHRTAIDVFRDAESALIDLLRVVASEGTGTGNGAALDSLKHYTTLLCIHTESLGHLRKAVRLSSLFFLSHS